LIAGKIIPAMATTTSMVVGLVTCELLKLLLDIADTKSVNGLCNGSASSSSSSNGVVLDDDNEGVSVHSTSSAKFDIERYRNSYVNLALPLVILSEPMVSVKTTSKKYDPITQGPLRAKPEGFTPWMKVSVC
jgi:ubiquitin-activating enzyme E1